MAGVALADATAHAGSPPTYRAVAFKAECYLAAS